MKCGAASLFRRGLRTGNGGVPLILSVSSSSLSCVSNIIRPQADDGLLPLTSEAPASAADTRMRQNYEDVMKVLWGSVGDDVWDYFKIWRQLEVKHRERLKVHD